MQGKIPSEIKTTRRVPKQKRSREKVERILDSAEKLMAEYGAENVSTHQVAKHANVAVGSLYQFFPNIETVKIALVERAMNELFETTTELLKTSASSNVDDLSTLIIEATVNFYRQRPNVVRTILISRNSEAFQNVNDRLNEGLIAVILEFVSEQHKEWNIAELERKIRISILIGDVMTMLVWTAKDEQERQAYVDEWKLLYKSYVQNSFEVN